ncbi:GIN domain-containing protein [Phenylobacterium sp.]|uniref:GIN domain-containing protein n=1 Tax=Phenylobacterium sp. TaxID=1871053 RepID=UPI002EDB8E46
MIRVLLMIAVAGFVLSVGAISAAVAIGGPEAVANGGWKIAQGHSHWDGDWDWDDDDNRSRWGEETTRTLTWSGERRLDLDLAADVRYIQAAGPATVTVTGPKRLVDHVIVRGDTLKYEDRGHRQHRARLNVVVRAPDINSFDISGRNNLTIEGYSQPTLRLDVSGSADVTATGQADEIVLDLSGSSEVDLGGLKTKGAEVDISGSADATIAPTEWAKLDITGRGDVRLLTRPARLDTDVSGSGRVRQGEEDATPTPTPTPSPSPSPPPSPSPKGAKT